MANPFFGSDLKQKKNTGRSFVRPRSTVGPQPGLREASKAFSSKSTTEASSRAEATVRAVRKLAREKGIPEARAKKLLVQTAEKIKKRDTILSHARANKMSQQHTEGMLRNAGIPRALFTTKKSTFVTPHGTFETSGMPGGMRTKRRVTTPSASPRPTPSRTPSRY